MARLAGRLMPKEKATRLADYAFVAPTITATVRGEKTSFLFALNSTNSLLWGLSHLRFYLRPLQKPGRRL
jgi:hypothetical protein